MRLLVFSHKVCWKSNSSPIGWSTDGGFSMHMDYISSLFGEATILVPVNIFPNHNGEVHFTNSSIKIHPIYFNFNSGIKRKISILLWTFLNLKTIIKLIDSHDAIHCPIPSDIGTIGIIISLFKRKRLFVRHCGNWFKQETLMEHFWKYLMEKFAGGKNLFLTTGGGTLYPSLKNKNIKWIFSSSMSEQEFSIPSEKRKISDIIKMCIVCRMDIKKGIVVVINALKLVIDKGYRAQLTIVGDGPDLAYFRNLTIELHLDSFVIFTGKLDHVSVLAVMKANDYFCYPTMASEGFPKVVLEAMSQGLVVIATPVSILSTLLSDDNGIIIKESCPKLLSDEIIKLNKNDDQCSLISFNAIKASKSYSLENWRKEIANHLSESWNYKFKHSNYI